MWGGSFLLSYFSF
ncbi:hypothetical protein HPMKF8_0990, partial [Helicobacter pylori]